MFVETLTSVSATFFFPLSFSWTKKTYRELIFEVTKEEKPRPLNPDPANGFDDNRAGSSAVCRPGKLAPDSPGGPKVFEKAQRQPLLSPTFPFHTPLQNRLAVGTHRSEQILSGWELS